MNIHRIIVWRQPTMRFTTTATVVVTVGGFFWSVVGILILIAIFYAGVAWRNLKSTTNNMYNSAGITKTWDANKVFAQKKPVSILLLGTDTGALDKDDILFADTAGEYMMLEFPDDDVPHYKNQMIFDLQQRGIIPVIVHPERNTRIMAEPDLIYQLLEKGCLSQITASSYVGTFGKKVESFSRRLIEAG